MRCLLESIVDGRAWILGTGTVRFRITYRTSDLRLLRQHDDEPILSVVEQLRLRALLFGSTEIGVRGVPRRPPRASNGKMRTSFATRHRTVG
jgi:hypothetical protein